MHNNMPVSPSSSEWDEIAAVREVREDWGLEPGEIGSDLAGRTYGAKFDFVSGSPGYRGDLFVVAGDALSAPPMMLIRSDAGSLTPVEF